MNLARLAAQSSTIVHVFNAATSTTTVATANARRQSARRKRKKTHPKRQGEICNAGRDRLVRKVRDQPGNETQEGGSTDEQKPNTTGAPEAWASESGGGHRDDEQRPPSTRSAH